MKKTINCKKIINNVVIFISIVLIALLSNTLAFVLPGYRIHEHVKEASETFKLEGPFPELIKKYPSSIPDNNTDAWMLLIADYRGQESALEKGLACYWYYYTNESTGLVGTDNIVHIHEAPISKGSYTRYWLGWLLPLRLCLIFFSYSDIRMILAIIQFITLAVIFSLLNKMKLNHLIIPLSIALVIYVPIAAAVSMDYSVVFLITLFSIIPLLLKSTKIDDAIGYPFYFMIIGMTTSFFDFLTMPIITLGVPLLILLEIIRNNGFEDKNLFNSLIKMCFICSITWSIGYLGMWALKWILAKIIINYDILNAIHQAQFRSSHEVYGEIVDYKTTLFRNISEIKEEPFILVIVMGLFESLFYVVHTYKEDCRMSIHSILPYLIVGSYPFIWWYLLMNHSYIHNHFTYRNIIVSILSLYLLIKHFLVSNK